MQPEDLYERAVAGHPEAFERLLERYLPQLHAFVHARLGSAVRARESSLDVVQSVCRQLLAARRDFEFRGEERFRAWLFTAALNKLRDRRRFHRHELRDVAREEPAADGEPTNLASHFLTPSREAMGRETGAAVAAALTALPDDYREVITLARIVGLPSRVIGEVMDKSEVAVRQMLGRALLRLTRELHLRGVDVDR